MATFFFNDPELSSQEIADAHHIIQVECHYADAA
jgi:hypothetical protein